MPAVVAQPGALARLGGEGLDRWVDVSWRRSEERVAIVSLHARPEGLVNAVDAWASGWGRR